MRQHVLERRDLAAFRRSLQVRERSQATVEKYLREAEAFLQTLRPGQAVTKELVLAWKAALARRYAVSTVNGKLAALNGLFAFLGWRDCQVAPLRRQRTLFRDQRQELTRQEYLRLVEAAGEGGSCHVTLPLHDWEGDLTFRPQEIKTLRVVPGAPVWRETLITEQED